MKGDQMGILAAYPTPRELPLSNRTRFRHGSALTTARKKALLRCLIDKLVIHRSAPDTIRMRLVWRGGDASALDIPVADGSLAALSRHAELEARILERARGPGRRGNRRRADRGRTPLADARPRAAEHGAEHPPAARDPADAKPVAPAPGTRAPHHPAACGPARGQRVLDLRPRPQRHHRDHP